MKFYLITLVCLVPMSMACQVAEHDSCMAEYHADFATKGNQNTMGQNEMVANVSQRCTSLNLALLNTSTHDGEGMCIELQIVSQT